MKKRISKYFAVIFSFYLLLVSSGLTLSHIYCDKGERWITGSDMPPCELTPSDCEGCPLASSKKDCPEEDNRKKDTHSFSFKFEAFSSSDHSLVSKVTSDNLFPLVYFTSLAFQFKIERTNVVNNLSYIPPEIFQPTLSALGVFRI